VRTFGIGAAGHRAWRPLLAVASLALCVWGMASWAYFSSGSARASADGGFRAVDSHIAVQVDGEWYIVAIEFLMEDDGHGVFADKVAAAKSSIINRFPGAVALDEEGASAQFVQSGFSWTGSPSWSYNSAGKPGALTGDQQAIQAAAAVWGAAGTSFHFSGGGTSSAGTGACSGGGLDGVNNVGWVQQSGSILAVTCTWYQSSGSPHPAIEFDMEISPGWTWTTGGGTIVDLQSVITHEFGHAAGLNHSADSSAVMYFSYTAGTVKQALTADDLAGIQAIYGGGSPTPTPTASGTATSTPTRTPTPAPTSTPTPGGGQPPPPAPPPSSTATPVPSSTTAAAPSATASPTATPVKTPTPAPAATATPTPRPSLPLQPGSNLLTWPGGSVSPATAISANSGINAVYSWDPAAGSWKRFFPGVPDYVNSLRTLEQGGAYWFVAKGQNSLPYVP
jgi:hypothetical protein